MTEEPTADPMASLERLLAKTPEVAGRLIKRMADQVILARWSCKKKWEAEKVEAVFAVRDNARIWAREDMGSWRNPGAWDVALQARLERAGPRRRLSQRGLSGLWVAHNRHPNLVALALKKVSSDQMTDPHAAAVQAAFKRMGYV